MKTQQEVNNFFQENTVHVSAICQIVQYLKDFNLKLPNNVILHENGICQTDFFKWFENGSFKPGDVLVSEHGNIVLFSHSKNDVVYYYCVLCDNRFSIKMNCGIGTVHTCSLASESQRQRLFKALHDHGYEWNKETNTLKKIKYPYNYNDCIKALPLKNGVLFGRVLSNKYAALLDSFDKLLLCRDTYWKIAGEEMELGKPWKPEYPSKHYIFTIETNKNQIICNAIISTYKNRLLSFPTKEMRDAFYENFKDLIEQCKELL